MTNKFFIVSILILVSFLSITCKDEVTAPVESIEPGTRNYQWQIDTLNKNSLFNVYMRIWGKSENELYIISSSGDKDKQILKYKNNKIFSMGFIPFTPIDIQGFENGDIWLISGEFEIWKLQNSSFSKSKTISIRGYEPGTISEIGGIDSNDVFVVGSFLKNQTRYELLSRYNGEKWDLKQPTIPDLHITKILKNINESYYYLLCQHVSKATYSLALYDQNSIKILKEFNTPIGLFMLGNQVYLGSEGNIFRVSNGRLSNNISLNFYEFQNSKITGRTEKDLFCKTRRGIGHYNGTDLKTLVEVPEDFLIIDSIIFEESVFFLCYHYQSNICVLIRGTIFNVENDT